MWPARTEAATIFLLTLDGTLGAQLVCTDSVSEFCNFINHLRGAVRVKGSLGHRCPCDIADNNNSNNMHDTASTRKGMYVK